MLNNRAHQNEILQLVIDRLNAATGAGLVITGHPDEKERSDRACDAYAEAPGHVPVALEHTLIQTYDSQKKGDAEFMRVIGILESDLKDRIPFRLLLTVPLFAIQKGQQWAKITEAIKTWLLSGPSVAPGASTVTIPDVPFPVKLRRDDDSAPMVLVGRWADNSLDVERELAEMITGALADKDAQLAQYRRAGDETVLVLESQDVAFANRANIYLAFLDAWECCETKAIDQVWLAATIESEDFTEIYCLFADQTLMDKVNPANARFGPRFREEWR